MGKNTEKYITFSVAIKKELDNGKSIKYKIKFVDSFRFMSSSLSNVVDDLSQGLHSDKCIDCKSCLGDMMFKDTQLIFRCFECNKNYSKNFNKELIKRFANIYHKYQVKPHSSPWFSAACAAAIVHRNHFFCLYQQNKSSESKIKFRQASNHCKRVLEATKLAYATKTKESNTFQKLGSRDFW